MNGKLSLDALLDNKEKTLRLVIILLIAIAAVFVFFIQPKKSDDGIAYENSSSYESTSSYDASEDTNVVICDVSGAVNSPQVVELKKGDRIEDAIQAAGGLTAKADISNINRAAVVNDGDKILIPEKGAATENAPQGQSSSPAPARSSASETPAQSSGTQSPASGKININSADSDQLQTISGVGPVTAQKIIDYRTQNGAFRRIEDLTNVSGIGEKTFEKMKDQICV